MGLPAAPPATTSPAVFKTFWQDTSDTAADHETRLDDLEVVTGGLATIPIYSAAAPGLTTSLATVAASWWRLDPANWPTAPAGMTLQYRVHVIAEGMTTADVLGARLYDADGAVGMMAEFTKADDGDSTTEAVSSWETFPSTPKSGYVQVRNQTGARGTSPAAFIEVRIA